MPSPSMSPLRRRLCAWVSRRPVAPRGPVLAGLCVLGLVLWTTPGLVLAHAPASRQNPRAESLTQDLVALGTRHQLANLAERVQILRDLLTVASERQQLLAALVEDDPGEVLRLAFPAALRQSLPPAVQALIEAEVEREGAIEVLHEDHDTGSRYLYFLRGDGQRWGLHFAAEPPTDIETGAHVRVRGVQVNGALALSSSTSVQTLSVALPNTFGAQKTLVMLVTFADKATPPYTVSYAQSVFTTTSNFDLENSYGQTWLTGVVDLSQVADVRGWYTLALTSTVCDYNTLASQAKSAAQAAGVDLTAYTRYVYAFPQNACTWWGLGSVGGNPSQAWINGSLQLKVVSHEMGHNLGLYHSHSMSCDTTGCTASEYGDGWDTMGNPSSGHYNAYQKERLGWLNYGVSPPLTAVTASGTYRLDLYEPTSANSKALKLWKSTNPSTGQQTYYYVEYRSTWGVDSGLAAGVLVHTGTEGDGNSNYLWDLAQTTTTSDWMLDVGQSYTDANAGVTLTTVSTDSTGAFVQVTLGPQPCAGANPTVALSPSGTQNSTAGATVTYTVTVTDNDSTSCGAATFTLQASAPAGWTATFAAASLTLSPGTSGSTTLTLTSSLTASGLSSIPVTAANGSYVGTASASVSVSGPCTSANPTVALSPTSQSVVPAGTVAYSVTVTDTDSASCPAATFTLGPTVPSGWTATLASTTLPLSPGASATTTLTLTAPASASAGSYSGAVKATNSGAPTYAATAPVTAVVTSLTVSVKTDKTSYKANQPVQLTATVSAGGSPVTGASVTFTITKGSSTMLTATNTTGSTGTAVAAWTAKPKASGTYQVQAVATWNGSSGSATTSFMVQ